MMTKEGSTEIVNFMTLRAGVLVLGHSYISYYSESVLSSTRSIYSTLIAIVLRDYDVAFLYHHWFIFSMMGLLIYKYEPFWQEVSVKSVILRWLLRPVGLLLLLIGAPLEVQNVLVKICVKFISWTSFSHLGNLSIKHQSLRCCI